MKIAFITRPDDPVSLRVYAANMTRHISALGADIALIEESGPIPATCDLVWDPGLCMRRVPSILATSTAPVVVTIHGVKAFSLPLDEIAYESEDQRSLVELKATLSMDWQWLRKMTSAVIAVSRYAAEEAKTAFNLASEIVHVVYNGVDIDIFKRAGARADGAYFLAVANSNPIKNLNRIIAAYASLPHEYRPELVVLSQGLASAGSVKGVRFINSELSQKEVARWYRGAVALVFPSLRETFGLPIIEAMASGCPVITSHDTGCAEIACDAALLVDPRSTSEISNAMARMICDSALRLEYINRGLTRAKAFSWHTCAQEALEILRSVAITHEEHHKRPWRTR